jgi:hypothetical protein
MSDESAAALEVVLVAIGFVVPVVLLVVAGRGDNEEATADAAGEPTPVIELVCRTSIAISLFQLFVLVSLINPLKNPLVQARTFK